MWFWDPHESLLRLSTYTASLNHAEHGGQGLSGGGTGYLTPKTPTYQHHCLAHVLSNEDTGTATADTEVWGGPLSGGDFVMAAVNRGGSNSAPIRLNWTMLELSPNVSQLIDSIDFSESVHKSIHYSTIDILFVCLFQSNSTALLSACLPACLSACRSRRRACLMCGTYGTRQCCCAGRRGGS
jgi:hypothetical protein